MLILIGLILLTGISAPLAGRLRFPLKYEQVIVRLADQHHLEAALLAAIVYEESRFEPESRSPAGAVGLMQLMPDTAGWAGAEIARPELAERLTEAGPNLTLGSWYYRYLLDKYHDEHLALAAYNGGEDNLNKWIEQFKGEDSKKMDAEAVVEQAAFPETRDFVRRVRGTRIIYRWLYPQLN